VIHVPGCTAKVNVAIAHYSKRTRIFLVAPTRKNVLKHFTAFHYLSAIPITMPDCSWGRRTVTSRFLLPPQVPAGLLALKVSFGLPLIKPGLFFFERIQFIGQRHEPSLERRTFDRVKCYSLCFLQISSSTKLVAHPIK
jgi:hypothetical protein